MADNDLRPQAGVKYLPFTITFFYVQVFNIPSAKNVAFHILTLKILNLCMNIVLFL